MSEEFQKWISNKKFQIFDEINETSNKDNKDFVVLDNDLLSSSDIRVYHSKQSIIESILESKPIDSLIINANNNVLKWFNDIKLRKQVLQKFNDLLNISTKVLEFLEIVSSNTSAKVSQNRVKNLIKSLNYGLNNQIFNYTNETQIRNIGYTVIKVLDFQSFVLKTITELIGCLVSGIPVVLIVEDKTAVIASYLLDLLSKSGLESGIIQMVIINHKNAVKLNETTKPTIAPIFVIFESADIESAINRIISSYINDTIGSIDVFVQQSVYKKFCHRIKTCLPNALEIGERFDPNVDILSEVNVNYDAIDFDNENKSFGIQVFKFRTNEEMKNLVNHFTEIPYISLWAEKTSLALEFARIVDSSEDIYINSSLRFPIKTQISVSDKSLDKTDLNMFSDNKSFESLLNSNKKWKTTPDEERERIIKNFLISRENPLSINTSTLQTSNHRIEENVDKNGIRLKITDFEAIGLVVIKINGEFNKRIFGLILNALISGNSVVIIGNKPIDQLNELKEYLSSLGQNIFNSMDLIEPEVKGNTILTSGTKSIGLYLQELENISEKSFLRFKKSITLSFGDISYAK